MLVKTKTDSASELVDLTHKEERSGRCEAMDGVREVGAVTKRGSVRSGLHLRGATVNDTRRLSLGHRLNMELDLQSLFGLLCTAVLIG